MNKQVTRLNQMLQNKVPFNQTIFFGIATCFQWRVDLITTTNYNAREDRSYANDTKCYVSSLEIMKWVIEFAVSSFFEHSQLFQLDHFHCLTFHFKDRLFPFPLSSWPSHLSSEPQLTQFYQYRHTPLLWIWHDPSQLGLPMIMLSFLLSLF